MWSCWKNDFLFFVGLARYNFFVWFGRGGCLEWITCLRVGIFDITPLPLGENFCLFWQNMFSRGSDFWQKFWAKCQNPYGVFLDELILRYTDHLSKKHQSPNVSVAGESMTKMTVATLQTLRTDEKFDKFWELVNKKDEVGVDDFFKDVKLLYLSVYYEALDLSIAAIHDSFDRPGFKVCRNLQDLLFKVVRGKRGENASNLLLSVMVVTLMLVSRGWYFQYRTNSLHLVVLKFKNEKVKVHYYYYCFKKQKHAFTNPWGKRKLICFSSTTFKELVKCFSFLFFFDTIAVTSVDVKLRLVVSFQWLQQAEEFSEKPRWEDFELRLLYTEAISWYSLFL